MTTRPIIALASLLLSGALAYAAPNQPAQLFDGRAWEQVPARAKVSASETSLVRKEVERRSQQKFLKKRLEHLDSKVTNDNFSVTGVAQGSFTRPGARQKAYLYRYSYTNGVVITDGGKIVAHYSGDPGDYAFYIHIQAADLDRNGTSELVLLRNVEDSSDISAYLFELQKKATFLGETPVYGSDQHGGDGMDPKTVQHTAYRLQSAGRFRLTRDTFHKTGSGAWNQVGTAEKVTLKRQVQAELTRID